MAPEVPPWQPPSGPVLPLVATPARPKGSIRRTSSIDVPWPGTKSQTSSLEVRGRDLRTEADGSPVVEGTLELHLEAELGSGAVLSIEGPDAGGWSGVIGAKLRSGFGRTLAEPSPEPARKRSLAYSVLGDLAGAFLVAGYAMVRTGAWPEDPATRVERAARQADVCIGWAEGTPVHSVLLDRGGSPIPYGPVAPALEADDLTGWHELPVTGTHTVRRRRALDVGHDGDGFEVWSHLRDSYAAEDGEMVMHEYLLTARIDSATMLVRLEVEPRVLPWAECPGAVVSAQALVGSTLGELDVRVRTGLVGPHGCTHLNTTLRGLADVAALGGLLMEGASWP